jgi:predicted transcriptional regulator of viral defense system
VTAIEALRRLRALRVPVLTTADAATALELRTDATSHTLHRLASAGLVHGLRKGLWAVDRLPEPMSLVEYLTLPYPAYVSLQSALYLRQMIEQIPAVVYAITLGRSAKIRTPAAAYSVHHLSAELFGGFAHDPRTGVKLALPEKALFDMLYLSGTRTRLFRSLPELELPPGFRLGEVRRWIARIPSARLRRLTLRRLEELGLESTAGAPQRRQRGGRAAH